MEHPVDVLAHRERALVSQLLLAWFDAVFVESRLGFAHTPREEVERHLRRECHERRLHIVGSSRIGPHGHAVEHRRDRGGRLE